MENSDIYNEEYFNELIPINLINNKEEYNLLLDNFVKKNLILIKKIFYFRDKKEELEASINDYKFILSDLLKEKELLLEDLSNTELIHSSLMNHFDSLRKLKKEYLIKCEKENKNFVELIKSNNLNYNTKNYAFNYNLYHNVKEDFGNENLNYYTEKLNNNTSKINSEIKIINIEINKKKCTINFQKEYLNSIEEEFKLFLHTFHKS